MQYTVNLFKQYQSWMIINDFSNANNVSARCAVTEAILWNEIELGYFDALTLHDSCRNSDVENWVCFNDIWILETVILDCTEVYFFLVDVFKKKNWIKMQSSLMRLHNFKVVRYNIELLTWSHKMDLIAISNDKGKSDWTYNRLQWFVWRTIIRFLGEVIVQRLNLQVLWTQPPPFENARVCGIGWRPDERILAIGKKSFAIQLTIRFSHQSNRDFIWHLRL